MSGSIEHLLHVQREKQRLDDELRIARDIQKSLLPVRAAAHLPGVSIRRSLRAGAEVGGDYYDFFDLGEGRTACWWRTSPARARRRRSTRPSSRG